MHIVGGAVVKDGGGSGGGLWWGGRFWYRGGPRRGNYDEQYLRLPPASLLFA